ncbi:MAG: zinc ribbon domain-containing protein [Acidobacteriota bacterium]|nr:zinc ribbon domain-containing protein [Acidobacteriota bacterium]
MPLYDYRCGNCGNEFEALQSASEDPLTDCTRCGEPKLKKVPAAPAFSFKGGGWYKDLYGSAGKSGGSGGSSESGSKEAAKSSDSSSSKSSTGSADKSSSSD